MSFDTRIFIPKNKYHYDPRICKQCLDRDICLKRKDHENFTPGRLVNTRKECSYIDDVLAKEEQSES